MVGKQAKMATIRITVTAVFMAINIALSSFGIPVPGGHIYLCDVAICLAGILLNPLEAFAVGGIGSFLGDMIFYPQTMFVSLVTHGLQGLVVSLISHRALKSHPAVASGIGVAAGAVIMVAGYTIGKIYFYSTPAYAWTTLPYEAVQAAVGAVLSMVICWRCGIHKVYDSIVLNRNYRRR